jgi:hypothetical protein
MATARRCRCPSAGWNSGWRKTTRPPNNWCSWRRSTRRPNRCRSATASAACGCWARPTGATSWTTCRWSNARCAAIPPASTPAWTSPPAMLTATRSNWWRAPAARARTMSRAQPWRWPARPPPRRVETRRRPTWAITSWAPGAWRSKRGSPPSRAPRSGCAASSRGIRSPGTPAASWRCPCCWSRVSRHGPRTATPRRWRPLHRGPGCWQPASRSSSPPASRPSPW